MHGPWCAAGSDLRGCSSETTFHQSARTSPPEQPRPAGHPGPCAARHRFGGQPRGSWTAGLLPRRAGAGAAGPSRFPDSGPGVREGGLCLSRRGRPAAAHDATRRTGVCPRSLSARPRHRLSPAARRRPVLGLSPLAPDCGERTQRHFCRVSAGREGSAPKTPSSLFLPFPPPLTFHLREEPPRRAEEEAGTPAQSAPSSLTRSFLLACPFFPLYFSFLSPLPTKPSLVGGTRGETWLVGIVGRESSL